MKKRGRPIYLTAPEERVLAIVLDLARGCGELNDMPPEYKAGCDMDKLLEKFNIRRGED